MYRNLNMEMIGCQFCYGKFYLSNATNCFTSHSKQNCGSVKTSFHNFSPQMKKTMNALAKLRLPHLIKITTNEKELSTNSLVEFMKHYLGFRL